MVVGFGGTEVRKPIDAADFVVVDGDDWRGLRVLYKDVRLRQLTINPNPCRPDISSPSVSVVPAGCGSQLPRHQQTTCL